MRKFGTLAALLAALFLTACDGGFSLPGMNKVSPQALRRAAEDPRIEAFYELRQWEPAWSGEAARDLLEAIRESDRHGIDADRFLAIIGEAPNAAHEEAAMTLAAISYAEALSSGMADPKKVWGIYTVKRPKADVVAGLNQAVESGDVGDWLAGLAPQDDEYRLMSDAYVAVRRHIAENKTPPVPTGPTIKPGGQDARIPQIAQALHNAGFFAGPVDPQSALYIPAMVPGVKGLQEEAGIKADGTIGNETIAALNSVLSDHAQQLALNLERRRWLSREVAGTRIDVNTAAAMLSYYRGGQLAHSARVVVGKGSTPTPQLASNMFQLVANPPWNVPEGIAQEEIFPKGAGYMASQGMYVTNGRVVQRPGPKAALGVVKFDLDNRYAIYLHDTPAKALFATDYRHKSHGCVRVHNAVAFARMLANEQGKLGEFDRKLASGGTGAVALKDKIPVRLVYHTVFLDPAGRLVYLPDPYGWDERLAQALGMEAPRRQRIDDGMAVELGP